MIHPLNHMQWRFVQEYFIDLNVTQAALRAGYSRRTARVAGARLLTRADVQEAIEERRRHLNAKTLVTQEAVIHEMALLGFADMRNYVTLRADGEMVLDWSHMPPEATKAIAEITQEEYLEGKGEEARTVRKTKFKLHDKKSALDSLAARLWPAIQHSENKNLNLDVTLSDLLRIARGDKNPQS